MDFRLSPASFFTVVALCLAAYYFLSQRFRSSNNHRRSNVEVTDKDELNGNDFLMAIQSSDVAEIPKDLITEILLLLPVKTLLRFRCISKLFCGIIDSSDFVNWHLRKTTDNRTHRKILIRDVIRFAQFPSDPIHVIDIDDNYIPFAPPAEACEQFRNGDFAHCNGLVVLLGNDWSSLIVWNPSTNKHRNLSILATDSPTDQLPSHVSGCGIGYDSSIDDYKIFLIKARNIIIAKWPCGDYNAEYQYEIWISGLRSVSWRKIGKLPDDVHWDIENYRNCFVDSAFHFLCVHDICALDVANETFSRLSLPGSKNNFDYEEAQKRWFPSDLQVIEGCLSVSYFSHGEENLELYVRKNDRGEFYWTKLFRVTKQQFSSTSLGSEISYSGFPNLVGGDGIIVLYYKYVLCSYDFKETRMKRIVVGDKDTQNIIFCIESLVPVDYSTERKKKRRKRRNRRNRREE